MKKIAFLFTNGPYGNSSAKEGLDFLLSMLSFTEDIGVFFISDGVLLLLDKQNENKKIFSYDFISSFKILSLYKIKGIYFYFDSVKDRGLDKKENWRLNFNFLSSKKWDENLSNFNFILTF